MSLLPQNFYQRFPLMKEGMVDFQRWLEDLSNQGLSRFLDRPVTSWEAMEKRMVDCKMPGLAKQISILRTIDSETQLSEYVLDVIAKCHLAARALQFFETMPELEQYDLLSFLGVTFKKTDVLKDKGVVDAWLGLGVFEGRDSDQLRFRKTHFLGLNTGKKATILDYAWGDGKFEDEYEPGKAFQGEMVYYPSSFVQRALLRPGFDTVDMSKEIEGVALNDALDEYAEAISRNPWIDYVVLCIKNAQLAWENGVVHLCTEGNIGLPCTMKEHALLQALTTNLNEPSVLIGSWNGFEFDVLSSFDGSVFFSFNPV